MKHRNTFLPVFLLLLVWGCSKDPKIFQLLDAEHTGVTFSNDITTTDEFNAIYFEYIYNGSGVAATDVNGDGLPDLIFTGNQVSSRLYLNKGGMEFVDVTAEAGLETDRWCTGVAVADVNNDGKKDIYISVAGFQAPESKMENLLFINEGWDEAGVPHFTESAARYGLNDSGYSTQGAFFDYDLDGDLDLYLLTNALEKYNRNNLEPKRVDGEAKSTDRLYRNNGDETFTNVSKEAGIIIEGYGLGVQVSDLNFDGFPDVYTANDFLSNDLVWINNRNGTFTNRSGEYLKHQTHNGMGVDIADFNNDALPDIAVLDMLPEDNYRQKMMIPKVNYDKFWMKRDLGYDDQYMRNTVQLNQGFTPNGSPRFSEIGNLTGMAATDWSWAVLFADLDNDGWKDTYITNGYRKDVTNLDFINYSTYNQMFGTVEAKTQKAAGELEAIPDVEVSNYLFHNKGGFEFENATEEWGLDQASFSNGAAYVDLDNDGDLDLVVNNIDSKAFIFENTINSRQGAPGFTQIKLEEQQEDLTPYNAKVLVYAGQKIQYQELSPFRGYKSTVDEILHFGLGEDPRIDSVVVYWLNGMKTILTDVVPNQRLTIRYEGEAKMPGYFTPASQALQLFSFSQGPAGIQFRHADNDHTDLKTIRTLAHDHSKSGPAIATGDINGDGLEDLFVGGNRDQAGRLFVQDAQGNFSSREFLSDSLYQDIDALLFDADTDGDNDLYVVSGGTFEAALSAAYQDRLYWNDGQGNFSPAEGALPEWSSSGSCVRAADYDGDGDLDLFVGGRVLPGKYPESPKSALLKNEGGKFRDVTPESLREIGLVTDAVWTDFNGDQQTDLIVVGEWLPITFFENHNGKLELVKVAFEGKPDKTNGWWMHIQAADLDQDGDTDYLVGNLGLNSKLKASETEPVRLYAKDFDQNGTVDPLFACYIQGKEYLMHERDVLIDQIPGMKRRFPDYHKYAEAGLEAILTTDDLEGATIKSSYMFASIILENKGNNNFHFHQLPMESQLSPVMGSIIADFDLNGTLDILTVGNWQATETTQLGWYDASYGSLLLQESPFSFKPGSALAAGLQLDGDMRVVKSLPIVNGNRLLLFGVYGGELKSYLLPGNRQKLSLAF